DAATLGCEIRRGNTPLRGAHRLDRMCGLVCGWPPDALGRRRRHRSCLGSGHGEGTLPLRGASGRCLVGCIHPGWRPRALELCGRKGAFVALGTAQGVEGSTFEEMRSKKRRTRPFAFRLKLKFQPKKAAGEF